MQIIESSKSMLELFPEPGLGELSVGMINAIAKSCVEQKLNRELTQDEIKFRFGILYRWAKVLRGDLSWGVDRICDEMTEILRAELNGKKYEPPKRQCWMPGDGA